LDDKVYTAKVPLNSSLCEVALDLYTENGNVVDDMSRVCDGYNYLPSDNDRLKEHLVKRCSIDSTEFYMNFDDLTGTYLNDISCHNILESEMSGFKALKGVEGNLSIEDSSMTTLNELLPLTKVRGSLSIKNNTLLEDISGLSNVLGTANEHLIIDDTNQYTTKADSAKDFCTTSWNLFNGVNTIANDMTKVCQ